jgi:hypothetical protein
MSPQLMWLLEQLLPLLIPVLLQLKLHLLLLMPLGGVACLYTHRAPGKFLSLHLGSINIQIQISICLHSNYF